MDKTLALWFCSGIAFCCAAGSALTYSCDGKEPSRTTIVFRRWLLVFAVLFGFPPLFYIWTSATLG